MQYETKTQNTHR